MIIANELSLLSSVHCAVGMTAVLLAVDCDHSECVRELLCAGANPDGPSVPCLQGPSVPPCLQRPALSTCSWQAECVEVRETARTPLVSAMLNTSLASLRLLLQAGSRLDITSRVADTGQLMMTPSELLSTDQCTLAVQRIVYTAATALGLQVAYSYVKPTV